MGQRTTADESSGHDPEPWAIFEKSLPGWFRVTGDFPTAYVGCALDVAGRIVVRSLILTADGDLSEGLDSTDLRAIPIRRIRAAVAAVEHRRAWVNHELAPPLADAPLEALLKAVDEGPRETERVHAPRTPLQRPTGRDLEAFYSLVAEAYRHYAAESSKPVVQIAAEANVPVPTARRWIHEARRRGHLPEGRRGEAQ